MPGAGHFSRRGLQATEHSASIRAGTVLDGQNQQIATKPPVVTIEDGRPTWPHHATNKLSRTQHQIEISSHPARSAHGRCIHPASGALTSINDKTTRDNAKAKSKPSGGHSGLPLRRGFVSMKGISGAVNRFSISSTARTNLPTRRRVECGAGVPGAGHFSRRGLQATEHSASIRADTVPDGQNQQIATKPPVVTIEDGRPT